MSTKVVVIGGVAGGASAAAKARRDDENAEIVMFEKGPYASFANCGLPYFVGGTIEERGALFQVSHSRFENWFNIDLRVNHEVTKINRDKKQVEVINHITGEELSESYDKLIVATGGKPFTPPIPGIDSEHLFTLTTVPDADDIMEKLEEEPETAVVIGAGFIGIESAEELWRRGLDVTIIEMADQILPPLDKEMTTPLMEHLNEKGIKVLLGEEVVEIKQSGKMGIRLKSGRELSTDFAILATGIVPRVELLKDADIDVSETGVIVNEWMQTTDPDIYAAGDIVESPHMVTGEMVRIPLAGPANKQGRIAGAHAVGSRNKEFKGVLGTSILKVLDLTAGSTGLNEKECKAKNIDYYSVYLPKGSWAGYFPGAETMMVKILVDKMSGELLGAQVVGQKGVDKRVDIFATALAANMTVEDLEDLDLAYAPPYSSAKGPAIMSGMIAADVFRGEMDIISPLDLKEKLENNEDIQLIDVRTEAEYKKGHIDQPIWIELDTLRDNLDRLDPEKYTVIYCKAGYRAYLAYKILKANGFKRVDNLTGGILGWNLLSEK